MGKREKILLALMIAAIVYGGFEIFYLSGRTDSEPPSAVDVQSFENMGQQLDKDLQSARLTEQQRYVLEAAAKNRKNDFFYVLPEVEDAAPKRSQPDSTELDFDYTGYLEVGERRMAIINGMEYEVGESLNRAGSVLMRITPENVLIETRQNGGGSVLVPYSE